MDDTAKKVAKRVLGAWENLPKGWTQESLQKMWESLTGDRKHKVTACIKKMEGDVDDPGAFCASLADKMEPGWRSKEALSRPSAKGNPAYEALSDAWDAYDKDYREIDSALDEFNYVTGDDLYHEDPAFHKKARSLQSQARKVNKSTYAWRSAFNYLLEGRNIDAARMTNDVAKTLALLEALQKNYDRFSADLKSKYPAVWKESDFYFRRADRGFKSSIDAFKKAVKLLEKTKTATTLEDRVASAYLEGQGK